MKKTSRPIRNRMLSYQSTNLGLLSFTVYSKVHASFKLFVCCPNVAMERFKQFVLNLLSVMLFVLEGPVLLTIPMLRQYLQVG